jgi:TldD protein
VAFSGSHSNFYMLNSEGTIIRRPEPLVHLQAHAAAQAPDGSVVRDSLSLPRLSEAALPPEANLKTLLTSLAENVRALAKAEQGENYTGPVLFEGIAGTQVLAELLVPNLNATRRPVSEPGRPAPYLPSELEGRMDFRFLPETMDVIDDPTQKSWNGQDLLGYLDVDEEGVAAKPVVVIEKGRFKSLLTTRQPVKGYEASNGRARMPGAYGARSASVTNLFIRDSAGIKAAELKARFLKMLTERNKPWGIIVRKMDFPSAAPGDEVRRLAMAASQSGSVRLVSAPVLAYKVYPDGREELVRGLRFRGLTVRSLRDVVASSQEQHALHYLNNMAPMALLSAGGYVAPVSVVGPALLFDELELEKPRDELPKLPVVPPPPLTAAAR